MITAPYMTDYYRQIRPEFLDKNDLDHDMYSFALGALDAPEVIAAGSHYQYKYGGVRLTMPSSVRRMSFETAA